MTPADQELDTQEPAQETFVKWSRGTYLALDLELNQPSRRIIQVGVAIGHVDQEPKEWTRRSWLLSPQESLNPTIVELTGITDEQIAQQAVSWSQMATELGALIHEHKPFVNPVSWGEDSATLKAAILEQGLEFPFFGRRWIDVKTIHGLQFQGRAHQADVDAYNTLRLYFRLLKQRQALESMVEFAQKI
jgi:hypothetical protein